MAVRIAAFPKCYLDAMMPPRRITWLDWIELAASLPHVQGLEAYPPVLDSLEPVYLHEMRAAAGSRGLAIPMMCASPDFTRPDPLERAAEIERQRAVIHATAELGGQFCRVLSGQRRPEVTREQGIDWTLQAIEELLPDAERRDVALTMENHYKDGFWEYPEFAQASDVFLEIIGQIDSPWFGVNYDPSNALIVGDDPLVLLSQVKDRVVSVHASDRSLAGGTLDNLRRHDADPMLGYAPYVRHGVVGHGLIDYDAIFQVLKGVGFDGWISIEDGQDPEVGMQNLAESAEFLHGKLLACGL